MGPGEVRVEGIKMEVDLFTAFVLLVGATTIVSAFVWAIERYFNWYYNGK